MSNLGKQVGAKSSLEGAANNILPAWKLVKRSGVISHFDERKIEATLRRAAARCSGQINLGLVMKECLKNIYDGATSKDLEKALILGAIGFIERDPMYDELSVALFLQRIYKDVMQKSVDEQSLEAAYRVAFIDGIKHGVQLGKLDKRLLDFPLEEISKHLVIERDYLFNYTGLQTLNERYFLKDPAHVYETPQAFWMRIAMGLAILEPDRVGRSLEFYSVMSQFHYVPSTPTLFHAATAHQQLSSCFLNYVDDELDHIFKCYKDNAFMSKWSGGVGTDWTSLRATGALIKTLNMDSQGLIPFLKIANDVTAAISRSGSRRGAVVAYLEVWHLDFEDYLDLRKNTGDERRRAHDMNTASWVPDLFIKRVMHNGDWTFFSPEEVPGLHDAYGKKFEELYEKYELMAARGEIKLHRVVPAQQLWRKMLSRLFETGHPWITFKDACNVRSPQDHAGVIHASNLCTEITLNTSREETAVCNLGSINLEKHVSSDGLDEAMLAETVATGVRMLDNIIDLSFYPVEEARTANTRHRPIGLGIMGTQDALFKLNLSFDDEAAAEFCDATMEKISYHAIATSTKLAQERGTYPSYKGSKWDRGLFPIDTIALLEQERGVPIECDRVSRLDWTSLRARVAQHGMRNSNMMAIAPTATISTIVGCFPSIEPIYKNLYVKANMSGEFTIVNKFLVYDLKALGLWDQNMCDQIKYFDGSIQMIDEIPDDLKRKYRTAFEIDPEVLLKLSVLRGKWIDQSQSHNVFVAGVSGKRLNDIYLKAWQMGMKTCYYLRTMGASQIEKSTLDAKKFGFTQRREYSKITTTTEIVQEEISDTAKTACSIENAEDCESCQ